MTDERGEREVSKEEYIRVERGAGFISKFGPNEIATAGFSTMSVSGHVEPVS